MRPWEVRLNTYWFDIDVTGPVADQQVEALADRLETAGGIDATVQAGEHGGVVMFSRSADDAIQAIVSAICDVEAAGMNVVGVAEDLVTVDDVAERAGVTATAVRYWITGTRGPGGFPAPAIDRPRGTLSSWAKVSQWLSMARVGEVDHLAAETAKSRRPHPPRPRSPTRNSRPTQARPPLISHLVAAWL